MSSILIFVETKEDQIKSTSLELLSKANQIASSTNSKLFVCIPHSENNAWTQKLGEYGVSQVYYTSIKNFHPEGYASFVENAVKKSSATIILATTTAITKDFLPRLSMRLDAGMISDCTALEDTNGKIVAQRPMYSGKCTVTATIENSSVQIVTCRPNIFEHVTPSSTTTPTVENIDVAGGSTKSELKEMIAAKSDKPDLTEAAIVVSAGRSIKTAENFKVMNDLADVLGAAVGASRAAVDAGYAPHSMQVGQTGKTVNPKLYLAFGISGAIQHLAGMRTSKVIVAVNSDAEAPIFQKCDYGIVGDLFEVATAMTDEFKKILS